MKHKWWTEYDREGEGGGGALTESEEEDIEIWATAGCTGGTSEAPLLPEDNQDCLPTDTTVACICDIVGKWGNALALFCVRPKEDGAN